MMLILSHIHFKNNFSVIYRAQKASFMCVRGTLVSRLLVLFLDKVYNVLGLHNFCRPAQSNSGQEQNLYMKSIIHFSSSRSPLHYHSQSCLTRHPPFGRNSRNMIRATFYGPTVQRSHPSRAPA